VALRPAGCKHAERRWRADAGAWDSQDGRLHDESCGLPIARYELNGTAEWRTRGPGCICGDVTRAGRRDLASAARHCACVRTEQDAIAGRSRRGTRRFACERTPPMQDLEIVVSKTKRPGATRIQGLDERRCGDHSPVESLAARSM